MIEEAFRAGDQIGVSAISLAEMVYLAEKGRIPSTAVHDLIQGLFDPEYPLHELPVDAAVAQQMASISRDEVPDMPDRIIAATGLRYGVPVISSAQRCRPRIVTFDGAPLSVNGRIARSIASNDSCCHLSDAS